MVTVVFGTRMREDADLEAVQSAAAAMLERLMEKPEFEFVDAKTFAAEDGETLVVARFGSEKGLHAWRDDPGHRVVIERGMAEFLETAWLGDVSVRTTFDRVDGLKHLEV